MQTIDYKVEIQKVQQRIADQRQRQQEEMQELKQLTIAQQNETQTIKKQIEAYTEMIQGQLQKMGEL